MSFASDGQNRVISALRSPGSSASARLERGPALVGAAHRAERPRQLDLRPRRSRRPGGVRLCGGDGLCGAAERAESGDPGQLGALVARLAGRGDGALGGGEDHVVARLALVVGELLEEERDVARLLVPELGEVLGDGVAADVGEGGGVAGVVVDGAEDAHLEEAIEGGLAVGLGLEGEDHLVDGLVLVLHAEVHVAEPDVEVGVALERLPDGLEVLEGAVEVAGVREGGGEVQLGRVVVGVHDGDALEHRDGLREVVVGERLLGLRPEGGVVDEALERGDEARVPPPPGRVLPCGRGGEEVLDPLAGLVDVEPLVREALELGLGDGHLRGEALPLRDLLVEADHQPAALFARGFLAHGTRR